MCDRAESEPTTELRELDPNMPVREQLRELATSLDGLTEALLKEPTPDTIERVAPVHRAIAHCLRVAALLSRQERERGPEGETVAMKEAVLAKLQDPRIKAVLDELVADRRSLNKALSDEPDSGLIGYIERAERIITALDVSTRTTPEPSGEALTDAEDNAIADVIWWIKGRLDAGEYRPFGEDHVEALRKARLSARTGKPASNGEPESFRAER